MAKHVRTVTPRQLGFTITELLVVVIILGVLAAVVTPGIQSADPEKLDLAASQVAEALRFARSEAMRTGDVHAVRIQQANETITVEKTNVAIEPVDAESILYHPVTKQSYTFDVSAESATSGVEVQNPIDVFHYVGVGRRKRVLFDAQGMPIYMKPIAGETYHLTNGDVRLKLGERQLTVVVHPYTGRVTIQ
jgi:prepilin-type N-terminal cleavage/methylation domain-containing protein